MQIFGGAKDFCPNFPKLTWKKLQRKWPPKKTVHLFKSKHNSSTIVELAQISPNLSENSKIKTWPPKEKNVCTLILGAIFVKSKHIHDFCEGIHTFYPNFHRFCPHFKLFCPDFHQIESFGGAFAPPPPTPLCVWYTHSSPSTKCTWDFLSVGFWKSTSFLGNDGESQMALVVINTFASFSTLTCRLSCKLI